MIRKNSISRSRTVFNIYGEGTDASHSSVPGYSNIGAYSPKN